MAITQRVGPHDSWLIAGGTFQCLEGSVELNSINQTGNIIDVRLPLNAPGYAEAFAGMGGETKCSVMVRAADVEDTLGAGTIKKIEFDLTGGIIHVRAEDVIATLHQHKSYDSQKNMTSSQYVQQLCSQFGVPCVAEGSGVMVGKKIKDDYVKLTDGQSVATVISKIAQMEGARYWVDKSGVLHYKVMEGGTLGGGDYSLFWKRSAPGSPMISDCISLEVIHNLLAASVTQGDTHTFQPYEKQSSPPPKDAPGVSAGGFVTESVVPNADDKQRQTIADAHYASTAQHEWEVRATFAGDPSVTPDMSVTLSGSGLFDRTYQIDKVTHRFGYSGFTTTINSRAKGSGS